jgi:glycosidase
VDRAAKGAFHAGDLKGLTAHLDEIADLGVTAIWINRSFKVDVPAAAARIITVRRSGDPAPAGR